MSRVTIRVPERGRSDEVPGHLWKELSRQPRFWVLVERGVLKVEQLSAGRVRLYGSSYVGIADVSEDFTIEAHEKVPGAVASLLRAATGVDFRTERLASPASELGPLIALIVSQFVESVRRYASRGRDFRYALEPRVGSLIGGRLDVTRTVRLRARGLAHLAAFEKNTIVFDVPINKTILAALAEVEHVAKLIPIPGETLTAARAMALLFADCRDSGVLFGRREDAARTAESLAAGAKDQLVADVLSLAAVILSHESFEREDAPTSKRVPRAWFLNLENVFEKAVRAMLARSLGAAATVQAGRKEPQPIFPSQPNTHRANPDIVVLAAGKAVLIGDVKYKEWSGSASASDIYQLLVHASAFGVEAAVLVYPHDRLEVRDLGTSVTGTRVRLCAVNLAQLGVDPGVISASILGTGSFAAAATAKAGGTHV
ncbi:5-methylcytosine restriction system specificity protein McrC [Archangium gephyra]|uniref:5-methylcytosine restriction system specificity protein McrC n=1 Tax=Archangium gephyra TaxID=48 RepID=UPI003B7E98A6